MKGRSRTQAKIRAIVRVLLQKDGLVVAFSGGVDSTVLAKFAFDALGKRAVAVTADSDMLPRSELKEARAMARLIGIRQIIVKQNELGDEHIARNPADRCYHCRKGLTVLLRKVARAKGFNTIADGANLSDLGEHRPGIRAADEGGIWHPFIELKVTKPEIRAMAKAFLANRR